MAYIIGGEFFKNQREKKDVFSPQLFFLISDFFTFGRLTDKLLNSVVCISVFFSFAFFYSVIL